MAPPVYHAWGLGMSLLAIGLGSTIVVRRRFDPEAVLVALEQHRCRALAVVPGHAQPAAIARRRAHRGR